VLLIKILNILISARADMNTSLTLSVKLNRFKLYCSIGFRVLFLLYFVSSILMLLTCATYIVN